MGQAILRTRRRWAGSALIAALALAPNALALQRSDARAIDGLYQRSLDLTQSLTEAASTAVSKLNAGGGSGSLDCLDSLRDASAQVSDKLLDVRSVADLAVRLRSPVDRRRGVAATRRAIGVALAILPLEARQASETAKLCGSESTVQAQGKALAELIGDATAELKALQG